MTDDITEAEWLAAIEEYIKAGAGKEGLEPGTMTAPRLAKKYNISEHKARGTLEKMMEAGTVRPDKVGYTNIWGETQRVKGFRLVTD